MNYQDALQVRRYTNAVPVTLSAADVAFSPAFDALWIGGSGIVYIDTVGSNLGTVSAQTKVPFTVSANTLLPVAGSKVYSSGDGTTATLIVALWNPPL